MKGSDPIRELFTAGSKVIDTLDVYRSLENNNIRYTNELMKKSASLDAVDKSIANMKREIKRVKSDNSEVISKLKTLNF